MSGLVAEEAHALYACAPLHLEHHLPFEADESWMGQVEGDAHARNAVRRAPFVAQPGVKTEPAKSGRVELFAEALHAVFEPRVFYSQPELTQANVEELFGR
jgi:hypothetical protein